MAAMGSTINSNQSNQFVRVVRRHAQYYIQGGDVVFRVRRSVISFVFCRVPNTMIRRQVEDTLFRVHRYFFTRVSTFFHRKLRHPPFLQVGEFTEGSSEVHPVVLKHTLAVDFERFLWLFYTPCVHSFYALCL